MTNVYVNILPCFMSNSVLTRDPCTYLSGHFNMVVITVTYQNVKLAILSWRKGPKIVWIFRKIKINLNPSIFDVYFKVLYSNSSPFFLNSHVHGISFKKSRWLILICLTRLAFFIYFFVLLSDKEITYSHTPFVQNFTMTRKTTFCKGIFFVLHPGLNFCLLFLYRLHLTILTILTILRWVECGYHFKPAILPISGLYIWSRKKI